MATDAGRHADQELSLWRSGGQVQAAGGALAGRAHPGHGDRVARAEPGQDAGQVVGRAGAMPVQPVIPAEAAGLPQIVPSTRLPELTGAIVDGTARAALLV